MSALFGFIGYLIKFTFLLLLWWLLGVFAVLPGVLLAAPAGWVTGIVVGAALAGRMVGQSSPAPLLTPERFAARPLPRRRVRLYLRRDRAWPHYFAGQAFRDAAALSEGTGDALTRIWSVPYEKWSALGKSHPELTLAIWPLVVVVAAFQITATVGAVLFLLVAFTVFGGMGVAFWIGGSIVAIGLRTFDRGWRTAFRARGSCPTGFHTFDVPVYRCRGPHLRQDISEGWDLHRDLRPGRQGVLYRRCACGQLLPTTVVRAAQSQQACCPYCLAVLSHGTGWHTDVRLPYFGATSAGKTHLIMAATVALEQMAREKGLRWSLPDEHSRTEFAKFEQWMKQGRNAPKTAGGVPVAVTVNIGRGRRGALVRFFDAAGETLADKAQNAELRYLETSDGLVFVLDPFSIPDVVGQFSTSFSDLFDSANAAVDNPQASYTATVSRLRDIGVDTRRRRLSFVLSKADLLAKLPSQPESTGSEDIAAWLGRHLESNLVTMARRDFSEVRFFLASVQNGYTGDAYRVIQWLLEKEGVRLA